MASPLGERRCPRRRARRLPQHLRLLGLHQMRRGDLIDRPRQGRNVAIPSRDCLAELTVKFASGQTMQSGSPDCRQTRITVTDDAIQIGSNASDRPPVQ